MDNDNIIAKLEEDFNIDAMPEPEKEPEKPQPVDIYDVTERRDAEILAKNDVKGSSAAVMSAISEILNSTNPSIVAEYNIAKNKALQLREKGNTERAHAVINKYMNTHFMPLIELAANVVSPDELLNNREVLRKLDDFALIWPTLSANTPYTASYIRTRYKNVLGEYSPESDGYVKQEMIRINRLMDDARIREAWGIAKVLKGKIDKGQHLASEEDYELLEKMEGYYGPRA